MKIKILILVVGCFFFLNNDVTAQLKLFAPGPKSIRDSNFIQSYYGDINLRAFLGYKYTSIAFRTGRFNTKDRSVFFPKMPLSIGVGGVYKIYGLNISYGIPLYKNANNKAVDLQSYIWGRKWLGDIFAQFYKGFDDLTLNMSRPDMATNVVGGNVYYLYNYSRFTYRAATVNDEWQYKSSGSPILGFGFTVGNLKSNDDIGLGIERNDVDNYIYKKSFFNLGPSIGYAYNLVIKKHYNILLSFSGRWLRDFSKEQFKDKTNQKTRSWQPGYTAFASAGYNNERWGLNFMFVNSYAGSSSSLENRTYGINISNARLSYNYRFATPDRWKKTTRHLDKLLLE